MHFTRSTASFVSTQQLNLGQEEASVADAIHTNQRLQIFVGQRRQKYAIELIEAVALERGEIMTHVERIKPIFECVG
jgi:hypothetical protein